MKQLYKHFPMFDYIIKCYNEIKNTASRGDRGENTLFFRIFSVSSAAPREHVLYIT